MKLKSKMLVCMPLVIAFFTARTPARPLVACPVNDPEGCDRHRHFRPVR